MSDPEQTPTGEPPKQDGAPNLETLQAELAASRAKIDELSKGAKMSKAERDELVALRKAASDADEKKKLAEGDFNAAKEAILKQKQESDDKAAAAERRYADKFIETAFSSALSLFGPNGLTTLPADFAAARFSRHVEFVPGENGAPDAVRVKDLSGEIIRGADGRPASFVDGMKMLIESWPNKETILRSAGRSGSGTEGGSDDGTTVPTDRAELIRKANEGDRSALDALKKAPPRREVTYGRHWQRQAAQS